MIKAIVLDVDGVIVGEKKGFNFPYPHLDVIKRLSEIRKKGLVVSLCTAKPYYSVSKIITDANLDNFHITEGGAVVIDPINETVLKKYNMVNKVAKQIVEVCLENGIYIEFYTIGDYFLQVSQKSKLTEIHAEVLQRKPKEVISLTDEISKHTVVKLIPIAINEEDKVRITQILSPHLDEITLSWGIHPVALPHQFGIITAKGVSKKSAVKEIAEYYAVKPEEILGVGDSPSDWKFMKECGYQGIMGNSKEELKLLASSSNNAYFGESVDENGILDIFSYFKITV